MMDRVEVEMTNNIIIATDGIQSFSNCIPKSATIWWASGPHFSTEAKYIHFALIKDFSVL